MGPIEHTDEDERRLKRYLLGELEEEERERLQEAYVADAALFSRLLAVEDDLIDAYVRRELTAAECQRFEQRFLQTRGQLQRVQIAGMLRRAADQRSPAANASKAGLLSWPKVVARLGRRAVGERWAAAAGLVLAATLGGSWWWAREEAEPPRPRATGSMRARPTSDPTPEPASGNGRGAPAPQSAASPAERPSRGDRVLALSRADEGPYTAQPPRSPAAVASVVLWPGLVREDGVIARLVVSRATRLARLRLELGPDVETAEYSGYQAVVQTAAGAEVTRRGGLRKEGDADRPFVSVTIPAKLLAQKDHVVLLSGERPDGSQTYLRGYSFSVSTKD